VSSSEYVDNDPDYAVWIPPTGTVNTATLSTEFLECLIHRWTWCYYV